MHARPGRTLLLVGGLLAVWLWLNLRILSGHGGWGWGQLLLGWQDGRGTEQLWDCAECVYQKSYDPVT